MSDEIPSDTPPPELVPIVPEVVPEPIPGPVPEPQTAQPEAPTAQTARNEPLPPEPLAVPAGLPARPSSSAGNTAIKNRKRAKLEKVMALLNAKGSITNDHVEKLLRVSDATATRYLSQLEKEGKVRQVGKIGKSVKYVKI